MINHEQPPRPDDTCFSCGTALAGPTPESPPRLKCLDCYSMPHLCLPCLQAVHKLSPFHRLLRWDVPSGFWHKTTTAALGITLYAGHSGRRCPRVSRQPRNMVIVHTHGVMKIAVSFCECTRAHAGEMAGAQESRAGHDDEQSLPREDSSALLTPEPLQLLRLGLYPASWSTPRTAFTLTVMRDFHLLSHQGNVSAHDYFHYLKRLTHNSAPKEVPVCVLPDVYNADH